MCISVYVLFPCMYLCVFANVCWGSCMIVYGIFEIDGVCLLVCQYARGAGECVCMCDCACLCVYKCLRAC